MEQFATSIECGLLGGRSGHLMMAVSLLPSLAGWPLRGGATAITHISSTTSVPSDDKPVFAPLRL